MSATTPPQGSGTASWVSSPRAFIAPLALAQFICSFAGSNMNVMINDISHDLHTDVKGVQTTITLFLVIMAVLMIPCSKLTDRWGRKRCFIGGLTLYGIGALVSAIAPTLGVLILGNSVFEGVGTAFLIPPVYILTTMAFTSLQSRARAFGVISGLGGIGAAAGPLIGGLITSAISWRAAFVFQALVVGTIVLLSRRVSDPIAPDPGRPFDGGGRGAVGGRHVLSRVGDPSGGCQQHAAGHLPGDRSRIAGRVLLLHPLPGAGGQGGASVDGALPRSDIQPWPGHAEPPMAASDGRVIYRLGLSPDRAPLRCDQDRRDLHRSDAGRPRLLARGGATGEEVRRRRP